MAMSLLKKPLKIPKDLSHQKVQRQRVIDIKKSINKFNSFVKNTINDFFVLLGISIVVYATYRINLTAAIYLVGVLLILLGLFLAWTRRE